jgi:hypothetical protein
MMIVFKIFGIIETSYFMALLPLSSILYVFALIASGYIFIMTVCYMLTCLWCNDPNAKKNITAYFVVLYALVASLGLILLDRAIVQ